MPTEDDEDSYELDDTEIEIEEDDSSIVFRKVANSTTDFSKDSNPSATEKPSLTFYQFLRNTKFQENFSIHQLVY